MKTEGLKHKNCKLLSYGLLLLNSHRYLGVTPDNIFHIAVVLVCNTKTCLQLEMKMFTILGTKRHFYQRKILKMS